MRCHPHPGPLPSREREDGIRDGRDRIDRACAALDALAALIGSCVDLHVVPADGLAQLVDILTGELRAGLAAA